MTRADRYETGDADVLGEEVSARRQPGSALVAVRVPRALLARLQAEAETQGTTVSDVIRRAAEGHLQRPPSTAIAITRVVSEPAFSPYTESSVATRAESTMIVPLPTIYSSPPPWIRSTAR